MGFGTDPLHGDGKPKEAEPSLDEPGMGYIL